MSTLDRSNLARALMTHVKNNDVTQVEKCLKRTDVTSWRDVIITDLELRSLGENTLRGLAVVGALLQCGVETLSPLHLAALLRRDDVIVTFFDRDVPVDATLRGGSTCLHMACFGGHLTTVKLLVDVYHADVTMTDRCVPQFYKQNMFRL